jgi:hypothetical protein
MESARTTARWLQLYDMNQVIACYKFSNFTLMFKNSQTVKQFLIVFYCMFLATGLLVAQSSRVKYNFNSDWKVFVGDAKGAEVGSFSDASWKNVTLPYAWNEDEAFKKDIVDLSTGIAWYRKHFKLPASAQGQKIFLEFEGIRQAGDFYINGRHIGLHENGITAFGFDVTDLVHFGDQ